MIWFICGVDDCPNMGVTYYWQNPDETIAQCGGCGAIMEAQND